MKQRIYVDTSVVGGYFDEELKEATQRLFKRLEDKEVKFIISDFTRLGANTSSRNKLGNYCYDIPTTALKESN